MSFVMPMQHTSYMVRNIWHFMETECPKSIKKPFNISVIAEMALSEPFFMPAMTVRTYNLFHAAVETGIVPPVSMIKRINGYTNRSINSCLPITSS